LLSGEPHITKNISEGQDFFYGFFMLQLHKLGTLWRAPAWRHFRLTDDSDLRRKREPHEEQSGAAAALQRKQAQLRICDNDIETSTIRSTC
jgi:hypothetical protein